MMQEIKATNDVFNGIYTVFEQSSDLTKKSEMLGKMNDILSRQLKSFQSMDSKALEAMDLHYVQHIQYLTKRYADASKALATLLDQSVAQQQSAAREMLPRKPIDPNLR